MYFKKFEDLTFAKGKNQQLRPFPTHNIRTLQMHNQCRKKTGLKNIFEKKFIAKGVSQN